jgi:hypothetical protein
MARAGLSGSEDHGVIHAPSQVDPTRLEDAQSRDSRAWFHS